MTELSPSVPSTTTSTSGLVRAPRVFISYAPDSDAHRERVRDLWVFLCAHGVDARIDRAAAEQRQDWTLWMEQQVAEADRILIVASPAYKTRAGYEADPGVGRGVQYEARLIRDLFYRDQADLSRFLPLVHTVALAKSSQRSGRSRTCPPATTSLLQPAPRRVGLAARARRRRRRS